MAIFDEKMAVGKSENLVAMHPYELTQPSDKEIFWGWLILLQMYFSLNAQLEIYLMKRPPVQRLVL